MVKKEMCDDCEESEVSYRCTNCDAVLCDDCLEDHNCYQDKIQKVFDELYKHLGDPGHPQISQQLSFKLGLFAYFWTPLNTR